MDAWMHGWIGTRCAASGECLWFFFIPRADFEGDAVPVAVKGTVAVTSAVEEMVAVEEIVAVCVGVQVRVEVGRTIGLPTLPRWNDCLFCPVIQSQRRVLSGLLLSTWRMDHSSCIPQWCGQGFSCRQRRRSTADRLSPGLRMQHIRLD
jgi:hypothetical protein